MFLGSRDARAFRGQEVIAFMLAVAGGAVLVWAIIAVVANKLSN
jgi:hypothetical protein